MSDTKKYVPVIQIEGPDGSGKSHLAKFLIDHHKAAYIHVSNYEWKKQTISQHIPMVKFAKEWAKVNKLSPVVLDRHWLTLLVYSAIFDTQTDQFIVDDFVHQNVRQFMDGVDRVVLCLPPRDKYLERFEEIKKTRPELYTEMDSVWDHFEAFRWPHSPCNLAAHFGVDQELLNKIVVYDYTEFLDDPDGKKLESWVNTYLMREW